ncbi:hypothetical protein A2U94_12335 [Bacillus sp. VT 712]|uniref:O-antigen ligase family protein n=1 Tax=Bacillus sp. VT 712 TaxID=1848047 RepID=UPI0007A3DA3E|nr:O-antigen ligase family protein [Bacillus sp. VT 712]KZB91155.1 hypothetical protein A2U94_12335 [Bacillus sp. VT 712]
MLCLLAILYAVISSIWHLFILLPVVAIGVYFLINRKLLFSYLIPWLTLYLVFTPIFGFNVSLSFTVLSIVGALSFVKYLQVHLHQKVTKLFIIYILCMGVGLIYSPNIQLGLKLMVYNILAFLILLAGQQLASRYSTEKILKHVVILGIPVGVINIIFLFIPNLEISFLKSSIAPFFVDPGALQTLFNEGYNNILDPRKAGTFFVNTNVAAVFFGILFWLSVSLKMKTISKVYNIPIIVYFLALLSTNSRAGLGAFIFVSIVLILLNINNQKTWISIIIFTVPAIILIILLINSGLFDNIVNRLSISAISQDPRMIIWQFAISHIHPIIGLGYGGWENISYQMGKQFENFPPHNHLLIVWSWSGILGVVGFLTLILGILYIAIKKYRKTKNVLYLSILGIYLTVGFQGMFDNYFFHNYNILVLLFLVTGLILFEKNSVVK